jgi:hypothetical protein
MKRGMRMMKSREEAASWWEREGVAWLGKILSSGMGRMTSGGCRM